VCVVDNEECLLHSQSCQSRSTAVVSCCSVVLQQLTGPERDPDVCVDDHEECEHWAQMGECERNPKFMKGYGRGQSELGFAASRAGCARRPSALSLNFTESNRMCLLFQMLPAECKEEHAFACTRKTFHRPACRTGTPKFHHGTSTLTGFMTIPAELQYFLLHLLMIPEAP